MSFDSACPTAPCVTERDNVTEPKWRNAIKCADDEEARRSYVQFWGDRYTESRAALKTMRDLLMARRDALDIRISDVQLEIQRREREQEEDRQQEVQADNQPCEVFQESAEAEDADGRRSESVSPRPV